MAEITIGGKVRTTAPMNFKTWKQAWGVFEQIRKEGASETQAVERAIEFVSFALSRSENEADRLTPDQIEEELMASEIASLQGGVVAIMRENGFVAGEAPAAAESA